MKRAPGCVFVISRKTVRPPSPESKTRMVGGADTRLNNPVGGERGPPHSVGPDQTANMKRCKKTNAARGYPQAATCYAGSVLLVQLRFQPVPGGCSISTS